MKDVFFHRLSKINHDYMEEEITSTLIVTHLHITSVMSEKYDMELMVPFDSTQLELYYDTKNMKLC